MPHTGLLWGPRVRRGVGDPGGGYAGLNRTGYRYRLLLHIPALEQVGAGAGFGGFRSDEVGAKHPNTIVHYKGGAVRGGDCRHPGERENFPEKHALITPQPGPLDTTVDLAAKRNKIDGLGQKRLGSAFEGLSLGTSVPVGGDHDDGDVRSRSLGFRQ
jgi:hypothetical protein